MHLFSDGLLLILLLLQLRTKSHHHYGQFLMTTCLVLISESLIRDNNHWRWRSCCCRCWYRCINICTLRDAWSRPNMTIHAQGLFIHERLVCHNLFPVLDLLNPSILYYRSHLQLGHRHAHKHKVHLCTATRHMAPFECDEVSAHLVAIHHPFCLTLPHSSDNIRLAASWLFFRVKPYHTRCIYVFSMTQMLG